MGWAGASRIMIDVIEAVKPHVSDKDVRKIIYLPIIQSLEEGDWDTQDEPLGHDDAYDEAINELHPGWFDSSQ